MRSTERALFLTLWGILILSVAIWRFWPAEWPKDNPSQPVLKLSGGLGEWFSEIRILENHPSHYLVEIVPLASLIASLEGEERTFHLEYQLSNEKTVLFRGSVPCPVSAQSKAIPLTLPNPRRISAREIRFLLAH